MLTFFPLFLLFMLLALGMPIFLAMGTAGALGLYIMGGTSTLMGIFATSTYTSVAHYELLSIPLFILMAQFLTASRLTEDLFDVVQKWVGQMPGGLAIATIISGAGLGALCGTSTASASTLASAAVPEMKRHGYSTKLSMGAVSISGTLAIMIPPSGTLIIFGLISGYSIIDLFRAAVIPGLLTAFSYCVVVVVWQRMRPQDAPASRYTYTLPEKVASLRKLWPILVLLVVVLISLYSGFVTITEAAGLSALGAFLIPLAMGRMSFDATATALRKTLVTTAMIFTIILFAAIFGYYLTLTQIAQQVVEVISNLDVNPSLIVLSLVILYALLGFFMDQVAILFLTLPLSVPIVEALDFNMYWFAILIVAAAETGLVTPPVGLNCYVAAGAANERLEDTFAGVMPFLIAQVAIIVLLFTVPWLSLALI